MVGQGPDGIGTVKSVDGESADYIKAGDVIVRVDYYFRRLSETLLGDLTLANDKLGWVPITTLDEMVDEMVGHDLDQAKRIRIRPGQEADVSLDQSG